MFAKSKLLPMGLCAVLTGFTVASVPATAKENSNKTQHYVQLNLVSDEPDVAVIQDTNLVNSWGVAFTGTGPFWVSDNGTGKATVYSVTNDSSGTQVVTKLGLQVNIPGEGNPTGMTFNNTTGFHGDTFVFVSEDGTISGWRGALGTNAEVLNTISNAVYKGVTLGTTSNGPVLLAANFSAGTVDVFDTNTTLIAQFADSHAPAGYAPFNVQNVDGLIFVTFAKQDEDKEDDVPGPGHGLIDVLNPQTGQFHRFATGSDAGGRLHQIDSPWGVALAPDSFGKHGGDLLVGNFGSGTIMTFNAEGEFQGFLKGHHGGPVVIDGLWALTFGNGGLAGERDTLFFTAGPDDESHGLFGSLIPFTNRGHGHGDNGDDN
jgi:uncharacterized protein (TIGR03118 family)